MSERIVNDPSLHGWVEEDGKWVWDGQSPGSIEDGDTEGQITTWSTASDGEWTPEANVIVGDDVVNIERATIGKVSNDAATAVGAGLVNNTSATGVMVGNNGTTFIPTADGQLNLGNEDNKWLDGYFTGTVDAAGFTVNGQPISGGGWAGGNNLVIENVNAPENSKKWRLNVQQADGFFRLQSLNDDNSQKQSNFIRFNQDTTIVAVGSITAPDFIATSDERVKNNITTAPVGLIDSLKGREWDWKESGEKGSGVVAQEIEQVLPHLVHEDDEGMKSVSYMGLCAYLIEELKDCRQRLAVLEGKE